MTVQAISKRFRLALTPEHSISASRRPQSSMCSLRQKYNREQIYKYYWQRAVNFVVHGEVERPGTERPDSSIERSQRAGFPLQSSTKSRVTSKSSVWCIRSCLSTKRL